MHLKACNKEFAYQVLSILTRPEGRLQPVRILPQEESLQIFGNFEGNEELMLCVLNLPPL